MQKNLWHIFTPKTKPSMYQSIDLIDKNSLIYHDIYDYNFLASFIQDTNPEIVIHMAAQPLVRYSYNNPIETYKTNILGTVNILDASRKCESVKVLINVTSDKCYQNFEKVYGYTENDPMGGFDPYSSSKGCAELITSAYYNSYFKIINKGLASVRSGNVIGGGDWSEDRLIPDIIRSFKQKSPSYYKKPRIYKTMATCNRTFIGLPNFS